MAIKELKTDFIGKGQVRGFRFTQISKTDSAFLFLVNTGDSIYYEVFKRVINERYGCVSYPTDRAFGIWAWTTPSLTRAMEILNEITEKIKG
jgi:hypothetical protein